MGVENNDPFAVIPHISDSFWVFDCVEINI